jgi:hypothetical protein
MIVSTSAPVMVRRISSAFVGARTMCSRGRNSAAASMAQKSMKALAASGDEQISDAKARSCALSSTASPRQTRQKQCLANGPGDKLGATIVNMQENIGGGITAFTGSGHHSADLRAKRRR